MSKNIFLFHGARYFRDINANGGDDSGRLRTPITEVNAHDIHVESELDNDVGIAGELNMSRWEDIFSNLEVGDHVYFHVVPDAVGVRGLWAAPQDPVAGLTVDLDLVSVVEVARAYRCEADLGAVATYGETQKLDFSVGIGDSPLEAALQADLNCKPFSDYRSTCPGVFEYYDSPVPLKIGQAMYLRMTVTALPTEDPVGPCSTCAKGQGWPKLHYGLIVDKLPFAKTEMRDYCRCKRPICAGCDSPACADCDNCDDF